MQYKFKLTKRFTGGLLAGITIVELSTVQFPVGFVCEHPCAGDPYVIDDCEPLGQ